MAACMMMIMSMPEKWGEGGGGGGGKGPGSSPPNLFLNHTMHCHIMQPMHALSHETLNLQYCMF